MTQISEQSSVQMKRIEAWINRLEHQSAELLEIEDIEALTAKERIELALKCLGQLQRFVALGQQIATNLPENQTQVLIANIAKRMRGEA